MALLVSPSLVAGQSPSAGPKLSRDWKRVQTRHIEVVGNASETDLRRALTEVVTFRETLKTLFPRLDVSAPEPTTLVVFKDPSSFRQFAPRDGRGRPQENVGGYFARVVDGNFLVVPMFAKRDLAFQTIFHEYTHYVMSRNFRNLPRWLEEGLAEFYSTFEVTRDGQGLIGRPPPGRIGTLRGGTVPPLARLLTGESALRLFEDDAATAMFYAQSWAFVHFMTLGDDGKRRTQIARFVELLRTHKSARDAAEEAFGTTPGMLDAQLRRYLSQFRFPALLVERQAGGDTVDPRVTPITEADADALKGRLLVELQAPDEAARYIDRALAADPRHAEARIARGRLLLLIDREEEAVAHLTKSAAELPGTFAAQYFLGSALYTTGDYAAARRAYDAALKIRPDSAEGWFALSLAFAALEERTPSDAALRRAMELYSTPRWYFNRAIEAVKRHLDDVAIADARAYVDRTGAAEHSAAYAAFAGVIAARRIGRTGDADALLSDILQALPRRSWARTVAEYMQGELSDEKFLDRADDDRQRTEAHTYIAMAALQAGNIPLARRHLTWVKEKGNRHYIEYRLAIEELKRLERQTAAQTRRP